MIGWRLYWLAWLLVGFLVPEVIALTVKRAAGGTLSEAVWYWCKVTPGHTLTTWTALHVFVALFMVWLFVHLVLGYWR